MKTINLFLAAGVLACALITSCSKEIKENDNDASIALRGNNGSTFNSRQAVIFAISNEVGQNRILSFMQNSNGTLTALGSTMSGGSGNGLALGSEGALAHNYAESFLFAVNPGSNSISSFHIRSDGSLSLINTISSGGTTPVSLAVYNDWLYVANAGSGTVSGFTINFDGSLIPMGGSTLSLSNAGAAPGKIGFKPDGKALLVTERATNKVAVYAVNAQGKAQGPILHTTTGATPTGFAFLRGSFTGTDYMLVTQAMGGELNASTASTYSINSAGVMSNAQSSMGLHQTGSSRIATTKDGMYTYIANTGSNSITSLKSGNGGAFEIVHTSAASTSAEPEDIIFSADEKYVYNISKGSSSIGAFRRMNNEKLTSIGSISIPSTATGLTTVNKMFY